MHSAPQLLPYFFNNLNFNITLTSVIRSPRCHFFQAFPPKLYMLCSSSLRFKQSPSVSSSCLYVCISLSILITADKAVIPIKAEGSTRIRSTELSKYNLVSLSLGSSINVKYCEILATNTAGASLSVCT